MLDSPGLTSATIAVRRDPPTVEEDLRSTTVPDDPVQRRDLILIERARTGDLDAFNDLVTLYRTRSSRWSSAWSRTVTRPLTRSRRRSSPRTATSRRSV